MTPTPQIIAAPSSLDCRRFQTRFSLSLLALLALVFVSLDAISRSDRFSDWLSAREIAANSDHGAYYLQRGTYFDENDYFWYRRLPEASFDRGGVFIFGASTTNYAVETWNLPPPQQNLIHNLCYSGGNPKEIAQLIKYVGGNRGILGGDGAKKMVILGFDLVDVEAGQFAGVFPESVERSSVRSYAPSSGITDLELSPFDRLMRGERARTRSVALRVLLGQRTTPARKFDSISAQRDLQLRLGDHWQADLNDQMSAVGKLLDDLQAAHVTTMCVMLPLGSWCNDIPLRATFETRVRDAFETRNIPLLDCSHAVPDEDFRDPYHLNSKGAAIVQPMILAPALKFLHDEKLLN